LKITNPAPHIPNRSEDFPAALTRYFSHEEFARISEAVKEAERRTSGEIVPCVVDQSDFYEIAIWRAGAVTMTFVLGLFGVMRMVSDTWPRIGLTGIILSTFLLGGMMMLLAWKVPSFRRIFVGHELEERRVAQRSSEAFLTEEVFSTRDRTGILIFVSLLEHRAVVLGDSGISSKVTIEEWNDVVRSVVDGMKAGRPAEGLIAAIRKSGVLLEQKGITRRGDDRDELSDRLRTERGKR
jgi:putative membrane protein